MKPAFLETKLYIPAPRANAIPRPDLLAYLQWNLDQGKTFFLICAAAGYGKTTLLNQWLQQIPYPAGWLALDSNDNHLANFWAYICRALQNVDPTIGIEMLEALQSNPEIHSFEQIKNDLHNFINGLAKRDKRSLLVLDDYHLIENDEIHGSLAYFIEHMPSTLVLAVTTRVDPPLPLARWRSRGQMVEFRTANLQFSLEETALYLKSNINLHLPPSLLNLLYQRTEGWIAALQMLGLALQQPGQIQPQDTSVFLQRLSSNQRYIIDYLFEEVIRKEKADIQQFLLDTSILEPLSAELCVDIVQKTGHAPLTISQAQQTLETLNRDNLFIEAIDPDGCWFRYHHLFAEILQSRLRRDSLEHYYRLHELASTACQKAGLVEQAIQHAILSANTDLLIKRVFENAPTAIKQSNVSQGRRWLEMLPEQVLSSSLDGCLIYIWALFLNHDLPATLAWLPKIEILLKNLPADQPSQPARAEYLAIWTSILLNQKRYLEVIQLCEEGLQNDSYLYVTGILRQNLGYACFYTNDFARAAESLDKAVADSFTNGNLIPATTSVKGLVDACIRLGQPERAATICKQSMALFQETQEEKPEPSPSGKSENLKKFPRRTAGMILIGLGNIEYLKNDLETSRKYFNEAVLLLSIGGYLPLSAYAHIGLAKILIDEGQILSANETLLLAENLMHRGGLISFSGDVERERARFGLLQNDLKPAEYWIRNTGIINHSQFSNQYTDQDWLVYASYLFKTGREQTALDLVDTLIDWASTNQYQGCLIESLVTKSRLIAQKGQLETAREILDAVYQIPGWQSYQNWIDSSLSNSFPIIPPKGDDAKPAESISRREIEILQLLSEGCSNQDISERFFISIHTVKSHLKHIFTKLNVDNRSQAVHRARLLGIIE